LSDHGAGEYGYGGNAFTTGSRSSESLKAYSAVLAQRMRELCPGGQQSSCAATTASPAPYLAFSSSSGGGNGTAAAASVQMVDQQAAVGAAGDKALVIVEAGEPRRSLEDAAAAPAAASPWPAEQSQQQKWAAKQQQQQQQQQDAGGVVQRLAGAISTVSAEMHARRLAGFQSTSNSGRWQTATPPSISRKNSPGSGSGGGATAAGGETAAGAAAAKSSAAKQEMQQRVVRLSIDEDCAADQQQDQQQQGGQQQPQLGQQQPQMLGLAEITPAPAADQHNDDPQALAPAVAVTAAGVAPGGSPRSQGRVASSSLGVTPTQEMLQLQLHDVIGSGSFGVVYRATWRGVPAAVKVLQLPAAAGGSLGVGGSGEGKAAAGRREQMAVMETALGASIHHPNIVQV
jgi:hypothetical protein